MQKQEKRKYYGFRVTAMIALLVMLTCILTGCEEREEKERERVFLNGYRRLNAFLEAEESGATLNNGRLDIGQVNENGSREDTADIVYGSFERDGANVDVYCVKTAPTEDPAESVYVSVLRDDRGNAIIRELVDDAPVPLEPVSVSAGRETFLKVEYRVLGSGFMGSEDRVDEFTYRPGKETFAFRCLPADLTPSMLDEAMPEVKFENLSSLLSDYDHGGEKAIYLFGNPKPSEGLRSYQRLETSSYVTDAIAMKRYYEYTKSTWRNQLMLTVNMNGDFASVQDELVRWVSEIGVYGVTFRCGNDTWMIVKENALNLRDIETGSKLATWYPCYAVVHGDNPDVAGNGYAEMYYNASTLEPVVFSYSQERRIFEVNNAAGRD